MRPKKKPFLPALVFLRPILMPVPARAADDNPWIAVLEGEALGGYSQIEGRDGEFSSIDRWLVSPTLKVNDSLYWINLYNGTYNRSAQVVAQEEGGRQTETTQSHNLSTAFKADVNETWSLRPAFFAEWNFVNDVEGEGFGDGLYDYRDIGGGLESTWTVLRTRERENAWRLGFRFIDREYPNYRSLISQLVPGNAPETDEKDLSGYKVNLGYNSRSSEGWSWDAEGILFYKDYTDKKTINSNGVLQSGGREDLVEYLNATLSRPLGNGWTFAVEGQAVFNQSNLDFYDTHNTATLADDDFLPEYFDYFSFLARPSLTYAQDWQEGKIFTFTADYTFYALHYPGRKAQNTLGVYQTDDEQDYQHTFSAKLGVPINANWSWVIYANYSIADSNQEFEAFYLYDYNVWTAVTGISVRY